jgi:two-component system sensor histidine kinase BaeS
VLEQQFLLSVSHDLRTPLTSIRGYAEAISDGATPDPAQAAGVITREAGRLDRLVGDLLDLARLDAHAFTFAIADVDLGAVAAAAVAAGTPQAASHGLTLTLTAPPDRVLRVRADPDRLQQAVANLVENATKYAHTTIGVAVRATDGRAELSVSDDGPGISEEDLPHVFERLYVSAHRPIRSESGSGLGLAITRQLVERMGGEARAGRAPGGGAELTIALPLA